MTSVRLHPRLPSNKAFNRAEHWRALATRFDKLAITYRAGVVLALTCDG
ncbi:hypothetical protein [Nocardia amamiensis]|nr:hypothetical protein [Nocardia amamiensis]